MGLGQILKLKEEMSSSIVRIFHDITQEKMPVKLAFSVHISKRKYEVVSAAEHRVNCVFWENDTGEQKQMDLKLLLSIQACASKKEGSGGREYL